ncbi:Conserved_hypothetical protein [Hexamita inflata]|uniref:Uncharacterized protein n=1 Tax=Hexamita inflata TaxID=28002 RepID=A0ABP1I8M7_9EUKA
MFTQPYQLPGQMKQAIQQNVEQLQMYNQNLQNPQQQLLYQTFRQNPVQQTQQGYIPPQPFYHQPPQQQLSQTMVNPLQQTMSKPQKPVKKTAEEAEQYVQDLKSRAKVNTALQLLIRNIRVLEVLQRQSFMDPLRLQQIQESRSLYFNAIQQQLQAMNLTIEQLKSKLEQLNLHKQLQVALDYIYQNSTNISAYTKKQNRIALHFQQLLNALEAGCAQNFALKTALDEIIADFEDIAGKEGCVPLNWSGFKILKAVLAELELACKENGGNACQSWQHWTDQLTQLYQNQIFVQQWE